MEILMKICSKCKLELSIDKFNKDKKSSDNLSYWCKNCVNKNNKNYRKNNEIKINKYYQKNKEILKKKYKSYREEYYKKYRIEIIEYQKEYKKKNRDKKNKYELYKKRNDFNYHMLCNLRSRLWSIYTGKTRSGHMLDYINCSSQFLQEYILNKLTGIMTKENYGSVWEIDHILPCSSFDLSKEENIYKCFHYTNLQPLLISDNRSKNNKLNWIKNG